MSEGSKLAVGSAIIGNSLISIGKFAAFGVTGSAAMLSEGLHSLADTINQVLLMVGIVRATREADQRFPFGYGAERAVWALMSAVGIFFLGAGVTIYHGISTLMHPHELEGLGWAIGVLIASFVLEGIVLMLALKAAKGAAGETPLWTHLRYDSDPGTVAVVMEDAAACLGVLLAMGGIGLSHWTGNPVWDSVASISIGVLLGAVATWLISRNHQILVGPAVPDEAKRRIQQVLTANPAVEKIVRLRTRMLDNETYRVAADVDFDGQTLAEKLEGVLQEAYPGIESYEDFRAFAAEFADQVVDQLGDEVDAIEDEIQAIVPRVRYLDIETD